MNKEIFEKILISLAKKISLPFALWVNRFYFFWSEKGRMEHMEQLYNKLLMLSYNLYWINQYMCKFEVHICTGRTANRLNIFPM